MKRAVSIFLVFFIMLNVCLFDVKDIYAGALSKPNITSPSDGTSLLKGTVTVKWGAVSGADYYLIAVVDNTTGSKFVNNEKVTGTKYTISKSDLTEGHSYKVAVGAYSNAGDASMWQTSTFSVKAAAPTPTPTPATIAAPTISAAISGNMNKDTGAILVSWKSVDSSAYYYIAIRKVSTGKSVWTYNNSVTGTNFTIGSEYLKGLEYGTDYYIYVTAHKGSLNSADSNYIYFKTANQVIATPTPKPVAKPVVTVSQPQNGSTYKMGDTVPLSATATNCVAMNAKWTLNGSTNTSYQNQPFGQQNSDRYSATFTPPVAGTYTIEYYARNSENVVNDVKTLTITVAPVALKYKLSGYVKDSSTGRALSGVVVNLNDSSNWSKITDSNGYYEFNNVEANSHMLYARLSGYTDYQQRADVYADKTQDISIVAQPSTMKFTSPSNGSTATKESVTVSWTKVSKAAVYELSANGGTTEKIDSSYTTKTYNFQNGSYTMTIRAINVYGQELCTDTVSFTVSVAKSEYNVSGYITNSSNAIANATVEFNGASKTTNSLGFYKFENIAPGTYEIKIKADGYSTLNDNITVSNNDVSRNFIVSSSNIKVESITASPANVDLTVGQTRTLTVTVSPVNATNKKLNFSSSNSSIATVSSSGVVTGISKGSTTIYVSSETGGKSASVFVTVTKALEDVIPVDSITLSPSSSSIKKGEKVTLSPTISPANATNKNVTYSTSNSSIAVVNDYGVVTGVGEGTAYIKATSESGSKTAVSTITVIKADVVGPTMSDFNLNKSQYTIGDTVSFLGTVKGNDGTIEKVTVNIQGPDNRELASKYTTVSPNSGTYNMSNLALFKVGDSFMKTPGTYWVEVWAKNIDGIAKMVDVKTVTVVTDLSAIKISGVVRNPYTNNPIAGVIVTLNNDQKWQKTTGTDGYFEFVGVANGTHRITTEKELFVLANESNVQIPYVDVTIQDASAPQLTLFMIDAVGKYEIYGKVVDSVGKQGVTGAKITPVGKDGDLTDFTVTSVEDGSYRLIGIGNGTHTLKIEKDGYLKGTQDVTVADKNVLQDLSIAPIQFIDGIVKERNYFETTDYGVVPGVVVWLNNSEDGFKSTTDARGQYSISGVAPSTHYIRAVKEGYQTLLPIPIKIDINKGSQSFDIIMINEKNIPSEWAMDQLKTAYNNALMTYNTMFDVRGEVSRLEFCELAVRLYEQLSGQTISTANVNGFNDVESKDDLVTKKARAIGITNGTGDNNFSPKWPIERQDFCTMLYRMLQILYPGLSSDTSKLGFADNGSIATYAKEAVAFMSANGIVNGKENNRFAPGNNASKEEAVVIMQRTYDAKGHLIYYEDNTEYKHNEYKMDTKVANIEDSFTRPFLSNTVWDYFAKPSLYDYYSVYKAGSGENDDTFKAYYLKLTDGIYNAGFINAFVGKNLSQDRAEKILISLINDSGDNIFEESEKRRYKETAKATMDIWKELCENNHVVLDYFYDNNMEKLNVHVDQTLEAMFAYIDKNSKMPPIEILKNTKIFDGKDINKIDNLIHQFITSKEIAKMFGEFFKQCGVAINVFEVTKNGYDKCCQMNSIAKANIDFIEFLSLVEKNSKLYEVRNAAGVIKNRWKNQFNRELAVLGELSSSTATIAVDSAITAFIAKFAGFQYTLATVGMNVTFKTGDAVEAYDKIRIISSIVDVISEKLIHEKVKFISSSKDEKVKLAGEMYGMISFILCLNEKGEDNLLLMIKDSYGLSNGINNFIEHKDLLVVDSATKIHDANLSVINSIRKKYSIK